MRRPVLLLACLPAVAACSDSCSPSSESGPVGPGVQAMSDTSPPRRPPPLRLPHPPAPPLPDLPSLTRSEVPGAPPPDSGSSGDPCQNVWGSDQTEPLACARSLLFGSDQHGAGPVVSRKLLAADLSRLPAIVDHRLEGTEGPVRDQGQAPACTAFAMAAAIDHALVRWGGVRTAVSVMQIWSRYHSPVVETSLSSNIGQELAPDQAWPFVVNEAISWVPCSDYGRRPPQGCGRPVGDRRAQTAAGDPIGEFTEVEYLGKAPAVPTMEAKLASGQDLVVTLEIPTTFEPTGKPGARYIANYTRSAGSDIGHDIVIAGYVHFAHGTYFLLHNSWGTKWGDAGYAWIHEATLRRWSHEIVAMDAEPLQRVAGSRPIRKRASTTCASGLVPDSIRATCAPRCPDHSPRQDDVCASTAECPPGMVNLTGVCVLAAPTSSGRDPDSGVSWSCGPGGCSYELPREAAPACTGATCRASCPAPDFVLARLDDSLVCVE